MGSNGTIPLKDIWAMLDVCAPMSTESIRYDDALSVFEQTGERADDVQTG
jgi:hypothetical protein